MPLLELQQVTKTYKLGGENFQALKGISLTVERGEFVAILGPSGSGKSTLMNILGALDRPTTGKYLLRNTDVGALNDTRLAEFRNKEVGFIFQQFNLLARTSVYDNVALPGVYGQLPNLNERVLEVLDQVGLASKQNNLSNQLSGGQIQRVAIARALVMKPSIIMADEPTGNLDSKTAHEIMQLLKVFHEAGNTILLITHEDDIAEYAERKIKLKDGEIISDSKQRTSKHREENNE